MPAFTVERLSRLPENLSDLEVESIAEGFGMVCRLKEQWEHGENRFDRNGELLLGAFAGRQMIGVGGLNIDPYVPDPDIGRLRHLYVLAAHRRASVGATLVGHILAHAAGHFRIVRLWTGRASSFYDALGFETVDEPKATHRKAIL